MRFLSQRSPANKGFYQLDSVKFKREETGKHRLHVAPGDWVVAAVDRYVSENLPPVVDLEVARIGEVLLVLSPSYDGCELHLVLPAA